MTSSLEPRWRRWQRRALRLSALVMVPYVVVAGMLIGFQRSLLYPATQSGPLPARAYAIDGIELDDVTATTADGLTLHGWRAHSSTGGVDRPVVLFLHGNGGNRSHRLDDVEIFVHGGADVLLFDYRGYGENAGSPHEAGLTLDAAAVWDYATDELELPPDRIVLFGESLGGGVAVALAAERCRQGTPPAGLIVRSTFTSMVDAASYHYPWLPVRWALRDRYDSLGQIGDVTCPLLFLHGDADTIVPFAQGRQLFDAAPQQSASGLEKRFVALHGAGHNDVLFLAAEAVEQAVTSFLDRIGSRAGTDTQKSASSTPR